MSKCAYILLISIVTLGSCKVKWDFEVEDFEPKIVVDGWIESGNVAYVCLSQTRPLNSVVDSLAFSEIPIPLGKSHRERRANNRGTYRTYRYRLYPAVYLSGKHDDG